MPFKHVEGNAGNKILLYAISTCVWCKKTKRFLEQLGVSYDYIDVDLLEEKEKERMKEEVKKWNPRCSFPTTIINEQCIVGYDEKKIKEALKNE